MDDKDEDRLDKLEKDYPSISSSIKAFKGEIMSDGYDESDDDSDTELSPNEIPCPFCGQHETNCIHFLADFDCTSPGDGNYGIGLGGGALYEVEIIGEFFEAISDCYARARYKGKRAKLPKAPKDNAFQSYVRALQGVRLKPKDYKSEEDYCWDFHANIEDYAELVRGVLLELLDFDVCEKKAATHVPLMSSNYLLWYCSDASASAAKLKDELARCLSDFKRENGLV